MKKITDKEYKDFQEYKTAVIQGRIITPDGLRVICEGLKNDPEAIGKHFLTMLNQFNQEKPYFSEKTIL
ncbi:MAG: cytochrome C [Clostridia bacterium]|nr:cytochrome C [Clostridia bacterium]